MSVNSTVSAPNDNPDLWGHEAIEQMFLDDIRAGKLHHAYILCGQKGIGKATLAYRLARYLLSHDAVKSSASTPPQEAGLFGMMDVAPEEKATDNTPETATQSGLYMPADTPIFKRVSQSSHTDLLVLNLRYDQKKKRYPTEIKIDQARKASAFLSLTPAESSFRVVLIDAVDALNTQAGNALLKTLEEPPNNSIIILVCHKPAIVLPTILSRCRKVNMRPPTRENFDKILEKMAPEISQSSYDALHILATGSVGYAITLHHEKARDIYMELLRCMQPSATLQQRQKFAKNAHANKDARHWQITLDMWRLLVSRILLPENMVHIIDPDEKEILAALREKYTPKSLGFYADNVEVLLRDTEIYNIEKRQTALLLVSPAQILRQQVA
jgi:DNA polymerase-3 subunit delta'